MDPLLHDDKIAGLLWGLVAGEALALPIDGWPRDRILREHGRVVRLAADARTGALTSAARRITAWQCDSKADPSEVIPHLVAGGPGAVLAGAVIAASITAPALAASARAGRALARLGDAEDARIEAAGLIAITAATAFAADPYLPMSANVLLSALLDECWSIESREAVAALRAEVRRPPSPDQPSPVLARLPAPLAVVFEAVEALLLRCHSVEEAVVYAVNQGGASVQRGALAGAFAGLHRGAACVPERWTIGLEETRILPGLARALVDRRQRA